MHGSYITQKTHDFFLVRGYRQPDTLIIVPIRYNVETDQYERLIDDGWILTTAFVYHKTRTDV